MNIAPTLSGLIDRRLLPTYLSKHSPNQIGSVPGSSPPDVLRASGKRL